MTNLASIVLSIVLLFGAWIAPCAVQKTDNDDIAYKDSGTVYFDGDINLMSSTVTPKKVDYITRDKTKFDLAIRCPCYTFAPAVGSCAPVAGSNVVGFYDRYDENLIPNHLSSRPVANSCVYTIEDDAVIATTRELYNLMGTTTAGTTEKQFWNGLTAYCNSKGKTLTTYSCMTRGSFDYSKARTYIESNKPIVLFLSGYNVNLILEYENYDAISCYSSDASHVMVGFGYASMFYHTTTGDFTENYMAVASGLEGWSTGFFDIDLNTVINDALAVDIY